MLSVSLQTLVGFGLAMLVREKFKGGGILTTLILIPMMISPVVVGMFWKLMYNPTFGFFNAILGYNVPSLAPDWLASRFAGTSNAWSGTYRCSYCGCMDVGTVRNVAWFFPA